jgi:hypothetical protein
MTLEWLCLARMSSPNVKIAAFRSLTIATSITTMYMGGEPEMTLKVSKKVQHRVTVEDGQLYVDGDYAGWAAGAKVSAYKGAVRVEDSDGEVTYFYRGAQIERQHYGPDIFGHGCPPKWCTPGRRGFSCETLTEAMEQQDRKFYGPEQQK